MSGTIGVAILGAGIFVKEEHLPAVQKCGDLVLKGIYSRSLKSAQDAAQAVTDASGVTLYSEDQGGANTLDDLLARADVDAVIIALPITLQPDFIRRALRAGKHVLAEKPLAKDVATGRALIDEYRAAAGAGSPTLAVAECFRYFDSLQYAAAAVGRLGRVLGVRMHKHAFVHAGGKYFETPWRKVPEYQGGFLLDGGVHSTAALRMVLAGGGVKVRSLSAQTTQLQEHLPPVDTADAALRLDNGATGVVSLSFGTTFQGSDLVVACERGSVSVSYDTVTVRPVKEAGAIETPKPIVVEKPNPDGPSGVAAEVFAWATSIVDGKPDPLQSPEEALADLELIEAMLKSGEQGGMPIELAHQV